MIGDRMSIGEVAEAAGISRRTVRFYVQQKLLPAPHGLGRGKHYDPVHLQQLRRIIELQSAGHSLDEIRQILAGNSVAPLEQTVAPLRTAVHAARLRAQVWRRLNVIDGVELSFDASLHNPSVEDLLALREAIVAVFQTQERGNHDEG